MGNVATDQEYTHNYQQRLADANEEVRQAACLELGIIDQPFAHDLLLAALADPSAVVRQAATVPKRH
jgi:HEAT repeat protein